MTCFQGEEERKRSRRLVETFGVTTVKQPATEQPAVVSAEDCHVISRLVAKLS